SGDRSIAKMINFGIVYGISAYGLSENLEIPRDEAQDYIDAYLARFPLVQDFIQRTIEQAKRDGYVTSLLGRRRPVPEIRASNRQTRSLGERLAVNFVMQGSNADIIKVAMIKIHRRQTQTSPHAEIGRPTDAPGACLLARERPHEARPRRLLRGDRACCRAASPEPAVHAQAPLHGPSWAVRVGEGCAAGAPAMDP